MLDRGPDIVWWEEARTGRWSGSTVEGAGGEGEIGRGGRECRGDG